VIWAGGGYLLHLGWSVTRELPEPWNDWLGTVIYLIAFFYVFAFWPILSGLDRLCLRHVASPRGGAGAAQRQSSPARDRSSPMGTSRNPSGTASSSGKGR
jgi:hypothetical protein